MGRRRCPKPWKRGYRNAMAANQHYRQLLAKEARKADPRAHLLNQYWCVCGRWHIGHSGRDTERTAS